VIIGGGAQPGLPALVNGLPQRARWSPVRSSNRLDAVVAHSGCTSGSGRSRDEVERGLADIFGRQRHLLGGRHVKFFPDRLQLARDPRDQLLDGVEPSAELGNLLA
jgi:hypothetical protein